ncbi:TPA: sigma 54-interacting transcriptional regulator, partial [Enterococcus faecium]|nr:sigma 54-interacting transcriptional regulator [Enterococcus faecium]
FYYSTLFDSRFKTLQQNRLKEAIDQIKTAVLYPHNGLPILLMGVSGSGKTFLAEKIYEYAKEQQVIESNAPFIAYNCAQYFNFSINKIVENLTILDAMKVLRLVQKAVKELEKLMGIEFSNNQLFLLYMHCCSMIERILRKESVDEQADIKEYIQKEGHNYEISKYPAYKTKFESTVIK